MTERTNYKSVGAYRKAQGRQRDQIDAAIALEEEQERQGMVLAELMMDPSAEVAELAAKAGMPEATVRALRTALQTTYNAPAQALRRANNATLLELVDDRVVTFLQHMTDEKIRKASLRDQVYAMDRMFNIRQLLRGEPTQIVSVDDRKALNDLVPLLVKSAQRRGVVIEAVGRVIEDQQRGVPDSRVIATEQGVALTAASEGVIDVRGGVVEGHSSEVAQAAEENPNDPSSAHAVFPAETAGSTEP
jgi:hypothetical protein